MKRNCFDTLDSGRRIIAFELVVQSDGANSQYVTLSATNGAASN